MEHFAKIVNGYNNCYNYLDNFFRNISFSRSLIYEINIVVFLIICFISTPEVFIVCKKARGPRVSGLVNFDIPFYNKYAGTRKLGKLKEPENALMQN